MDKRGIVFLIVPLVPLLLMEIQCLLQGEEGLSIFLMLSPQTGPRLIIFFLTMEELILFQFMEQGFLHVLLTVSISPLITGKTGKPSFTLLVIIFLLSQLVVTTFMPVHIRSEEHTSELQSLRHLVCR